MRILLIICAMAVSAVAQCPVLEIFAPTISTSRPHFQVAAKGRENDPSLTYRWLSSIGDIVKGQGTSGIDVVFPEGGTVTVTVHVGGLPAGCPSEVSESVTDESGSITPTLMEEFYGSVKAITRARIAHVLRQLGNDPSAQLYISIYGTRSERARWRQRLSKVLESEIHDPGRRITFVDITKKPSKVLIWLVPAGGRKPRP